MNGLHRPHDANTDAVIFLHLGKTAGSTLGNIIDRQYPNNRLFVIFTNEDNEKFKAQPETQRANIQCLRGITYYGIHHAIPKPATYFTLLRPPLDRVISQYFHNQRRRAKMGIVMKQEPNIWDFLNKQPEQATLQLRMIVGGDTIEGALAQTLPENALDIAKAHLERHFSVVGLVDHFDETVMLLKQTYGWNSVQYGQRNVAPNRAQRDQLGPKAIARIEHMIEPELELYEWVQRRFEETLAAQSPDFHENLAKFRRTNQLYSRVWQSTKGIRKTAGWRTVRRLVSPAWEGWDDEEV